MRYLSRLAPDGQIARTVQALEANGMIQLMGLDIAYEGLFVLFPAGLLLSLPKKGQLNARRLAL